MSFGFNYNGEYSGNHGLIVLDVKTSILPPIATQTVDIPGMPGTDYIRSVYGVRKLDVKVGYHGANLADFRSKMREWAGWLKPGKLEQLIFDDEPDKYYMAVLDGSTDLSQIVAYGDGTLSFICPDPFAYAVNSQIVLWDAPYQGTTTLTNNGTEECGVKITIEASSGANMDMTAAGIGSTNYGTASSTSGVEITIGGVSVKYTGQILSGDVVVIDTGELTVTKNGVNALQYWSGDFPKLPAGTIDVSEFDQSGNGASIKFDYTERWI